MRIRVLGCHGSDQFQSIGVPPCRCCSLLINDKVLIDAGTVAAALTLKEQLAIETVCLTHLHFDHIKGLPTFADNVSADSARPVNIISVQEVLEGLRVHVFNDMVFPNFFALPHPRTPILKGVEVTAHQTAHASGLDITPIAVNHLGPAVGFVIRHGDSSVVITGDTYSTEEIWHVASRTRSLKAVFIESSFPNEMHDMARKTRHLTPSLVLGEMQKLGRPNVPVFVYHIKPRYEPIIERQLMELDISNISMLREEQIITV